MFLKTLGERKQDFPNALHKSSLGNKRKFSILHVTIVSMLRSMITYYKGHASDYNIIC